jgi:methylphosphotriester-DNA--protein-cysteine methyltransferase
MVPSPPVLVISLVFPVRRCRQRAVSRGVFSTPQGGGAAADRGGATARASSSEAIERVAQVTGFRDPERMRRAFIRAFGQPPQSLRRAARAG